MVNYANMGGSFLREKAAEGVQRAHYYLGREMARHPDWDGCSLEEAAQYFHAAIEHDGFDPGESKKRSDHRKYQKLAKEELGRVLRELIKKYGPAISELDEQGKEYLFQGLNIQDGRICLMASLSFLKGKIDYIDREIQDPSEQKARALYLLSYGIEQKRPRIPPDYGGDPEMLAAMGEGYVRLSYCGELSKKGWSRNMHSSGPTIDEEAFEMIEQAGDMSVHGYIGYQAAKHALDSLQEISLRERKRLKHAFEGKYKSESVIEFHESFLARIGQARRVLQRSKEADVDFIPSGVGSLE